MAKHPAGRSNECVHAKTALSPAPIPFTLGDCALLLAIGLIYGQTLGHGLPDYDDNTIVYETHVTGGWTGEGFLVGVDRGLGEWYPLAMLSHMLDCQLFGLNAWGHHLTNVLLHAATSIALLLMLWRMTGELWPSAFVAAVFAVHPQHVESVAWVAERRDVLSGLFFMLTLSAYLGYVRHGRSLGRYFLVAALFTLGLLAKPMIVTRRCPLCFCRLVLVSGHVVPSFRVGQCRLVLDGRSLHVSARHRALHRAGLGSGAAGGRSPEGRWALSAGGVLAVAVWTACATWQAWQWQRRNTVAHALACTTDNGEAEIGLADALVRRDQLDEAIPHYRRAVELAVDYTPFNNFGLVMAKQNKAAEAIALFRRAVEIEPQAFNPHVNLGLALAVTNQFDKSHEQFTLALNIDPLGVDAHRGLAYLLSREGKAAEARAELDRAIAVRSGQPRRPR